MYLFDRYTIGIPFLHRKTNHMPTLTVSPKYQVVIPKQIRESLQLKPGQKIHATVFNGRIELIPLEPMSAMRGFLPNLDTTATREDDRS
jgi:AbrB family looped-hinge helix DNA binding protein